MFVDVVTILFLAWCKDTTFILIKEHFGLFFAKSDPFFLRISKILCNFETEDG
jgi:hypothetical protein